MLKLKQATIDFPLDNIIFSDWFNYKEAHPTSCRPLAYSRILLCAIGFQKIIVKYCTVHPEL